MRIQNDLKTDFSPEQCQKFMDEDHEKLEECEILLNDLWQTEKDLEKVIDNLIMQLAATEKTGGEDKVLEKLIDSMQSAKDKTEDTIFFYIKEIKEWKNSIAQWEGQV